MQNKLLGLYWIKLLDTIGYQKQLYQIKIKFSPIISGRYL